MHPSRFLIDDLRGLFACLGRISGTIQNCLGKSLNGCERSLQLMRNIRYEITLGFLTAFYTLNHGIESTRQILNLMRSARRDRLHLFWSLWIISRCNDDLL